MISRSRSPRPAAGGASPPVFVAEIQWIVPFPQQNGQNFGRGFMQPRPKNIFSESHNSLQIVPICKTKHRSIIHQDPGRKSIPLRPALFCASSHFHTDGGVPERGLGDTAGFRRRPQRHCLFRHACRSSSKQSGRTRRSGPKRTPFAFAAAMPSACRRRIFSRSDWAT